jgi:two-component system LytT family response regulator
MAEKITAIIIDDERLARKELRTMLAEHGEIEVVGEADSVEGAARLIAETAPDVLFLDIQMPGETGFDLFEKIKINARIVFVTAFDQYAIRAFEVNAVDYLLKPVNPERLSAAVARLAENAPRPTPARRLAYDDRLLIEMDDRSCFLKIASIIAVRAAGDYSELVTTAGGASLVQKSLKEWEERLPIKHFARIHRSAIVNLEFVESLELNSHHSYQLRLPHIAEPLVISRRYAAQIKQRFG